MKYYYSSYNNTFAIYRLEQESYYLVYAPLSMAPKVLSSDAVNKFVQRLPKDRFLTETEFKSLMLEIL